MDLDVFFKSRQYGLSFQDKRRHLISSLNELTAHHAKNCPEYGRIVRRLFPGGETAAELSQVPFLPVGMFKSRKLKSVPDEAVFKILTSSGTTGDQTSQIFLDHKTATLQTQALAAIVTSFIGPKRLPMIIVDYPGVFQNPATASARAAGILGMMSFGRDHLFCLKEDLSLDADALKKWLTAHAGQPVLIFGFTFMVWRYFVQGLEREGIDLNQGILIHSGGWKKLLDEAVSNEKFKSILKTQFGIPRVHNFYGMVEQVGSVFMECENGVFHAPNFADVLMRDPRTRQPTEVGKQGVVQVLSVLPSSYPGHSLLTEDLGTVHGADGCGCGRQGTFFSIQEDSLAGHTGQTLRRPANPETEPRVHPPQH